MCKEINAFEATVSGASGTPGGPAIVDEDLCCVASICVRTFKQPKGPIKNIFLSHVEFLAVRF